ncbi:hypothetical protein LU631_14560 [Erwinia tracheiphila]|uniref:LysR family transcriptional regulator n=1 Tax=Erwinia tracheiphila TaxID=65700 RepID=UPI00033D0899|nr:LysR family transcriptional regulator [Erwinia tracheiphila]EOS93296.1 LysR family transcriptional regulator [Erwinia tracheiphila PSU-1]UIA85536.1 hypothetical protein LU604_12745 [Erwinia tracheiphila]UIA86266.1 hypothetical protein LU631_14560 [Erwinia tracheiphila]UIA98482.1 hypothetical protein LU633_12770 [Erwinia tracheiphila]
MPASFRRARLENLSWLALDEQDALSEVCLAWARPREASAALINMKKWLPGGS